MSTYAYTDTGSMVTQVKDSATEHWLIQDFPSVLISASYLRKYIRT